MFKVTKKILSAVILLLMVSGVYAQDQYGTIASSIKATKNTYVKKVNDKLRFVSYRNSKQEVTTPSSESFDRRAKIELLENKFIGNLLKEVFGIDKLRNLPVNESIILAPTFSKKGKVIDVSFLMPKEMPVTANELELLEVGLKKNLKVKVVTFEEGKNILSTASVLKYLKYLMALTYIRNFAWVKLELYRYSLGQLECILL